MIVGMDFGTTNSGMSYFDGQKLTLIPLDPSNTNPRVARTALYITNQRRITIGREAIEIYYAQNINREVKYQRVWVGEIALTFAELPEFVRDVTVEKDVLAPGRLFLSFKTGLRSPTYLGTVVGSQFYFLENIVALYLYAVRLRAQAYLETDVTRIVLGRPVRFSTDPQQDKLAERRLVHAAFQAGYDEVYLQHEPIAAAYFYETTIDSPQNVLIFDFGGGTLDVTIARLDGRGNREILATGGVPVAGDVFDQKIVRHTLPRHFGEGSHFVSSNGQRLPVPANFFEAFADWQEMLELNKPDVLQYLDDLARTAERRRQIRALINLIKSSYSLKMFDAAEAAKRTLSDQLVTMLTLNGSGFNVSEPLTRDGFEVLIHADLETVAQLLDDVLRQAGLSPAQIDAVIRTGGSAQIPAFICLLEDIFGPQKVRAIDTFSSVTSGLGILGHFVEQGMVDLPSYHRRDWTSSVTARQDGQPSAPVVDLDLMKKFIDLGERSEAESAQQVCIVGLDTDTRVTATMQPRRHFAGDLPSAFALDELGLAAAPGDHVVVGAPHDYALIITSEYRFFRRTLQELADLAEVNMTFAQMESFFADRFGRETISAVINWSALQGAERLMLISGKGRAKVMAADLLLPNFAQTFPYQGQRITGAPLALVPADEYELLLVTNAGSVARIATRDLPNGEQAVMQLRKDEYVIAAHSLTAPAQLLFATSGGRGKRIHTRTIPFSDAGEMGANVVTGRDVVACVPVDPDMRPWAVTTHRLYAFDPDVLPLDALHPAQKHGLLRLMAGEKLVALRYL